MNELEALYVASLAREMRAQDVIHIGAGQDDLWLAVGLARTLYAPGLRVIVGGTYLLGEGPIRARLPRTYARDLIAGRAATFQQSRAFEDLKRSRVTFAGAMQVDLRGNANLIAIIENGALRVRGPGSGGLPTLTSHSDRFFIAVRRHVRRAFVETVSRVSVLGDPAARAAAGLPPDALRAVLTPLARFEPGEGGLRVVEIAPGVSLEMLARHTGFPIQAADELRVRQPVDDREADALRDLHQVSGSEIHAR